MDMNKILATKESKLNFLKGLIRLSKSDGITDKSEKDFLKIINGNIISNVFDIIPVHTLPVK